MLTGGGNSFFAPRYGFGADNVLNFEVSLNQPSQMAFMLKPNQVILANGSLVNANLHQNADLYKALKGGNNNFGIITRFDMRLISSGVIWGGESFYSVDTLHQQLGYLQQFTTDSGNGVDDYAAIIWTYALTSTGPLAITNIYTHTKPRDDAPIFANFRSLSPILPPTTGFRNVSSIAQELDAETPPGMRWTFAEITIGNDAKLMEQIIQLVNTVYLPTQTVAGFQVSVDYQPITRAITGKSAATGGNSLGLDPNNGDLMCKMIRTSICTSAQRLLGLTL